MTFAEQIRLIPAREPGAILAQVIERYTPSKAFVLFSGGADSSVTLDYLWRRHRSIVSGALHVNTGIGLQSTRDFARTFCNDRGIPFHEAFAPVSYEDVVEKYGFPGPAAHGKIYVWLKERALDAWTVLQKESRTDNILLITGVRAEESMRRMGTCVDISKDGSKIWVAPLIDWSSSDMQSHRTYYSVPLCPASTDLHMSAECLCGAFGNPSELSLIGALYDDPVLGRIRRLETKMSLKGEARCRWGVSVSVDRAPTIAPGPLCVGCYKQASLPTMEQVQ